jgi:hypothetical protein
MGLFGKKTKEEPDDGKETAPMEGVLSHTEETPPGSPQLTPSGRQGSPAVAPAGIEDERTLEILQKVDEATRVMEINIAAAAQRGENLDDLQEKTSKSIE